MSQKHNNIDNEKNLSYLNENRIIYKRYPINDRPTFEFDQGYFYENGTNEYYVLFNTKNKINTFKYFIWTLRVLRYLNQDIDIETFKNAAYFIADPKNNISFDFVSNCLNDEIVEDVYNKNIGVPNNKKRKVIFRDGSGLSVTEKLRMSASLTGRSKSVTKNVIENTMHNIHNNKEKITFQKIADLLNVSSKTIYRNIDDSTKVLKNELNKITNEKL